MKKLVIAVIVMSMFAAGMAIAQPQGRDYSQGGQTQQRGPGGPGGPGGMQGPGAHRGPPEEALDACSDLAEGDACAFEIPARQIEGTCESLRQSDEVACVPEDFQRGEQQ